MMPMAVVSHFTKTRVRLKMPARRGNASYFDLLDHKITVAFPSTAVQVTPMTGSLLLTGDAVNLDEIADFGRTEKLFNVASRSSDDNAMALSIPASLQSANRRIQKISAGRVDLSGALFISLVIVGAVELMRGKWRTPPWYTAFWYAFGLYSKSLLDDPLDGPAFDMDGD
jgi:hypothetical protein